MKLPLEPDRDLVEISLRSWGRVVPTSDVVPWRLEDDAGRVVAPVQRYLKDLVARGAAAGTIRTYAYALLRWWRFLWAIEVAWNRATSAEARDFVLWSQIASEQSAGRRTTSQQAAGTVNPITGERYWTITSKSPRCGRATRSCAAFMRSGSSRGLVHWSTRCRRSVPRVAGRMPITTHCCRFAWRVGCGRSPMSCGMNCSQ